MKLQSNLVTSVRVWHSRGPRNKNFADFAKQGGILTGQPSTVLATHFIVSELNHLLLVQA